MATIHKRIESQRGCGYRKKGGTYLVSDGIGMICCRLPQELTVCPCCGEGIKQSRGWTWVTGKIFTNKPKMVCHETCHLQSDTEKYGLMWVGEKYYNTAMQFISEAIRMGVSKRIAQIPNDLEIGKTWVLLAHPKVCMQLDEQKGEVTWTPGIFQAFKPSRIEYIVTGQESEDELNKLEKRGFTLIDVIRDVDMQTTIDGPPGPNL